MLFLSPSEARQRDAEIRATLNDLLSTKALVTRPAASQWKFMAACVERLLSDDSCNEEYASLSAVRAAQLKFEVEDRLRRFYLRPGKAVNLVLTLVHNRDLTGCGVETPEKYPSLRGYCVLVRDLAGDLATLPNLRDLKTYLERVVTEAVDAEFRAYTALPEIVTADLQRWFCGDGTAYREIVNLLTRHRARNWVLSNPLNPSTKRLLSIQVRELEGNRAVVKTNEYWYLRWWDNSEGSYSYPYRETNKQTYVLHRTSSGWCIFENIRPSPRTSAPHRRIKS